MGLDSASHLTGWKQWNNSVRHVREKFLCLAQAFSVRFWKRIIVKGGGGPSLDWWDCVHPVETLSCQFASAKVMIFLLICVLLI